MWKRRTFHECTCELEQISQEFRRVYVSVSEEERPDRQLSLRKLLICSIDVLRALSRATGSQQDVGVVLRGSAVGALKSSVSHSEAKEFLQRYRPPGALRRGFEALSLRDALYKIAHTDPNGYAFYADSERHDLLLKGTTHGVAWVAIISIPQLCAVLKALPDRSLPHDANCNPPIATLRQRSKERSSKAADGASRS